MLTAGFPCQPFSVEGYRAGLEDKRGNHFFKILDFVDHLKPKVLFLENVKNFGIRLEDDVVIQDSGEPFNLMRNIPIEIEEIEDLINS